MLCIVPQLSSMTVKADIGYSPCNIAESESPSDIRLSPDARRLLYHVKPLYRAKEHETCAIWIADVDDSKDARQFSSGLFNDHAAQFHPDGERIIFLSDRHKAGGPAQIYSIGLAGGEASPLFGKERKKGVSAFKVSPDGRYIAFTSANEPTSEDEQRMKDKDDARVFGDKRTLEYIRLFTFATGSVRTLEQPQDKHVSFFYWAHDSKSILFSVREQAELEFMERKVELNRVSLAPESLKHIGAYPREFRSLVQTKNGKIVDIQCHDPARVSDSYALFVHSDNAFDTTESLYGVVDDVDRVIDLNKDNDVAISIAKGLKTWIDVVDTTLAKQEKAATTSEQGGGTKSTVIHPQIYETKDEAIESWDMRMQKDGILVLALIKSSSARQEPSNVWVGSQAAGSTERIGTKQISSHVQWMKDAPHCKAEAFYWDAKDGIKLDGMIFYPPGKDGSSGPFKTIMLIHGGACVYLQLQRLANNVL